MRKQKSAENTEHSNERENVVHSVSSNNSEVQPENDGDGIRGDARRVLTKKQIVKACHYREIGLSINEIAEIMGLSSTTIFRITKDVQPINPKQEDDANSPGPKSLSEKDLPSASVTTTTGQVQSQSQQTTQSQTPQRPAGPVRQSRLEDAMGPLDVEFEHPPPGENQYDDAGKRKWKRLMMMLYGKASEPEYKKVSRQVSTLREPRCT